MEREALAVLAVLAQRQILMAAQVGHRLVVQALQREAALVVRWVLAAQVGPILQAAPAQVAAATEVALLVLITQVAILAAMVAITTAGPDMAQVAQVKAQQEPTAVVAAATE